MKNYCADAVCIIDAVERSTGVRFEDMRGRCRSRGLVDARMIYAFLRIVVNGAYMADVAAELNHSRSTVVHYLKKYSDDMKFNPPFREKATRAADAVRRTETGQISTNTPDVGVCTGRGIKMA